jgi:arylsulfatase A-like enzyme
LQTTSVEPQQRRNSRPGARTRDCFGAGGHPGLRTPHLDRFFRRGLQFGEAFSPIPTTLAAHASMLTGGWPTRHGIPRNRWTVPDDLTSIAEVLQEKGIATAAFVSSAALDEAFHLNQGFDVYSSHMIRPEEREQAWRPAPATLDRVNGWWGETEGRYFLWTHFFEPHFPYDPDPRELAPYATGYVGEASGDMDFLYSVWNTPELLENGAFEHVRSLYYAEIAGLDRKLAGFLRTLADQPDLCVIITADHGESLGEYGLFFKHGPQTNPSELHVPLVVCAPGVRPGVSNRAVSTVDVARTILARLGVAADLPTESNDLLQPKAMHVYGVASMPWDVEEDGIYANARKQRVIRTEHWALRETPFLDMRVWFDRRTDPGELHPLEIPDVERAQEMGRLLSDWIEDARYVPLVEEIDPSLEKKLIDLGYIN